MINKQPIDISFAEGLDTKTDPKRVKMGKFLALENAVFDKGGLLKKRNGYAALAALPDDPYKYVTTFNQNLTAIGKNIAAYSAGNSGWVSRGSVTPVSLRALPVIRNNLNLTACDIAVAPNGTACAVYLESDGSTTTNKYVIFDAATGQNLVAPAVIPVASGAVSGGMRVFVLGTYFVIVFTNTITAVAHLQYVAISIATPANITANTDIAAAYIAASTLSWDGCVVNSSLYIAYNTTTGGQAVKVAYLSSSLVLAAATSFGTYKATMISVTADMTTPSSPVIWVSFYRSDTSLGYSLAVDQSLNQILAPTATIVSDTYLNMTSTAQNGVVSVYLEVSNAYGYDAGISSNAILTLTVTQAGSASAITALTRSVGLASKAFLIDSVAYCLGVYQSPYQNSYFLINATSSTGNVPVLLARLAYENGGGYLTLGLPGVSVSGTSAYVGYLFKDLIQAVNKNTNPPTGAQTAGIYSQTGVNLATFSISDALIDAAEIGNNLNISGGFLRMYDGYLPVEHNFLLYPDSVEATWSTSGGSIASHPQGGTTPDPNPGAYWYQVTYEWTDNQGNAFRSAPSIPVSVSTTGTGTSGSITINVPTLRLTMKTANKVKIVIYRWSLGQQQYFQVTSITSPKLNNLAVNSVQFVDTQADATILGNNLLYTTGGVVENLAPPATDLLALFDTRLWLVDAEDRNLLWFSKQVIEATPVEMSDLFTYFIPPTVVNATGEISSIAPMDDKLIISKGGNSFVYVNGTGPDNTGANNQYSQPIFITSSVGCDNQRSIAFTPQGMMFQSNKGIWLLGRDLSTSYVGAPVQDFTTGATVLSAVSVPDTNQVRFTLDSGITLMYDYYYDQWGTFVNVPAVSSCIYQDAHTYINSSGNAYQESADTYLDGSTPVLLYFKTGPIRLGDLQGYQRIYFFYLLGQFISPHKLNVGIYYDYAPTPEQTVLIAPTNYSTPYGSGVSQSPYGQQSPYGGPAALELWRVFPQKQRCMAINIDMQEIFDATLGTNAGAGLTLSGLNAVCGFKKGYRPQSAAESAG